MFIANIFVVILIYGLILYTFTIDKDVLYHVYILSVLYENIYKIICHTKTTIVLWKTLELNFAFAKKKKNYLDIYMKRKMIDNKYNLYQIYEFKIFVYDTELKWIILIDIMFKIM